MPLGRARRGHGGRFRRRGRVRIGGTGGGCCFGWQRNELWLGECWHRGDRRQGRRRKRARRVNQSGLGLLLSPKETGRAEQRRVFLLFESRHIQFPEWNGKEEKGWEKGKISLPLVFLTTRRRRRRRRRKGRKRKKERKKEENSGFSSFGMKCPISQEKEIKNTHIDLDRTVKKRARLPLDGGQSQERDNPQSPR